MVKGGSAANMLVKGLGSDWMRETTVNTLVQARRVACPLGRRSPAPPIAGLPDCRSPGLRASRDGARAAPSSPRKRQLGLGHASPHRAQNIGKAVYKDKEQIISALRKAYPPFKETKEFEFAFKIR